MHKRASGLGTVLFERRTFLKDRSVSDADADLASGAVSVVDATTDAVAWEATTAVSGETASGTDEFRIRTVDTETFDVVLTVTDARGAATTASRTVDESGGDPRPGGGTDGPAGSSHLES